MEYKTYRCDRCDKFNAIHIRIPNVDNNSGDTADGVVDLCPRCGGILPRVVWDQTFLLRAVFDFEKLIYIFKVRENDTNRQWYHNVPTEMIFECRSKGSTESKELEQKSEKLVETISQPEV